MSGTDDSAGTTPPAKIKPGPKNRAAIDKGMADFAARPVRVAVTWEEQPNGTFAIGAPHSDGAGHTLQLIAALGSTSSVFMARNLGSLEAATRERNEERGASTSGVNAALALIEAVGPQDELEGALAVQMASCHSLTMEMLCRAKSTDSTEHLQLYGNMAVKLQRTFTAQLETLARMRGKGQQTVRVEHVTVEAGAQAIVGDVHHYGKGGGTAPKSEAQPHGTSEPSTGAAMLGHHPQANGVPVPGDVERPVPAPRRAKSRRAPRQSERA